MPVAMRLKTENAKVFPLHRGKCMPTGANFLANVDLSSTLRTRFFPRATCRLLLLLGLLLFFPLRNNLIAVRSFRLLLSALRVRSGWRIRPVATHRTYFSTLSDFWRWRFFNTHLETSNTDDRGLTDSRHKILQPDQNHFWFWRGRQKTM